MTAHQPGNRAEPAEPGDAEPNFDAAEAAGVGGITWADEVPSGHASADHEPAEAPAPEGAAGARHTAADPVEADPSVAGAPAGGMPAEGVPRDEVDGPEPGAPTVTVEDLVVDLERVTAERDQYLDASRRLQAEFENYRKAVAKREAEAKERANENLVAQILPVLDACDGALASGATDVEPVRNTLLDALGKQGLTRIDDQDAPFDPERHEAVMHEPDTESGGPVVAEVMRAGYSWKGRVVRPAMVRVRG